MLTYSLQQADTEPEPAAPVLPTVGSQPRLIAPVIPENVPLRCSYDTAVQAYRCSYEQWYREPAVYTVVMVGILGFGLGFLIAAFPPVRKAVKTARSLSPI